MYGELFAFVALLFGYGYLRREDHDPRVRTPVLLAAGIVAMIAVGPELLNWIQGFELQPVTIEIGSEPDPQPQPTPEPGTKEERVGSAVVEAAEDSTNIFPVVMLILLISVMVGMLRQIAESP